MRGILAIILLNMDYLMFLSQTTVLLSLAYNPLTSLKRLISIINPVVQETNRLTEKQRLL
jgi:hypothetical protein